MLTQFETYMRMHAELPDQDIRLMHSVAIERTIRKKEFLLSEGEICRYKVFISSGLLRTYCTREDGSEHIIMFTPENRWTTDLESFATRNPSACNIDALEDSELLLWTKDDLDELYQQIPLLKAYSERMVFKNLNLSRQRIVSALSASVEEKYDEFIATNPDMLARVPLHMVASYLGVLLKTLSRVRHSLLKR